jgi:hypothetical protein
MSTYITFPQVLAASEKGHSVVFETSSLDETASSVDFEAQNEVILLNDIFLQIGCIMNFILFSELATQ